MTTGIKLHQTETVKDGPATVVSRNYKMPDGSELTISYGIAAPLEADELEAFDLLDASQAGRAARLIHEAMTGGHNAV